MQYNKHECTPQFKTLCDLIRTNQHSLWACKHIHTLKVKQLFKAGWELLLGGLQVWWVDTDRSQRISLSNTHTYTVLRYSEEAALVYASFGPNVMVWQAFSSPSSCSPTTPLHPCFPPCPFLPFLPSPSFLSGANGAESFQQFSAKTCV